MKMHARPMLSIMITDNLSCLDRPGGLRRWLSLPAHKHQIRACSLVELVGNALVLDGSNILKAQLSVQFPSIVCRFENRVDALLIGLFDSPANELLSYSAASVIRVDR